MIASLKSLSSIMALVSNLKLGIKKFWAWIKTNGHVVFVISSALILFIVTRKSVDFSKILKERKKSYEDEIRTLKDSHDKEIKDRDAATRRYQNAVKQIEENYAKDSKKLENSKKSEIKKLIKNNPDNPDEITKKISELTGFNIVDVD
ncbi:hypothetical protein OAA09_00615 [bacterium]|nr:hypothetical protein [bacterium]